MKQAKRIGKISFYVVLFLCLTAFAVSGFLMKRATEAVEEDVILNDWGEGYPIDLVDPVVEEPLELPEESMTELADEGGDLSGADGPAVAISGEEELAVNVFAEAVTGEVTCAFSMEELVHSVTFDDWRTHAGVDLAAELGAEVSVIADGVVSAIIEDPMMGQTVVVEHANGYASSYANLATDVSCAVGDRVSLGDVIGTIGDTAVAELEEPSHLHLELTLDQEQIDPMSVLKE